MGTAAANLSAAKSLLAENIFCGQTLGLKRRALNTVTAQLGGLGSVFSSRGLCYTAALLSFGDADTGTVER